MSQSFVFHDPACLPAHLNGAVVAIGNFDGVHRGHAAVISRAKVLAQKQGKPCLVLTFEPHPADYFSATPHVFRLTPEAAKARALAALGLDAMVVLTFNDALSGLSAQDFVTDILVKKLAISGAVVGYDFHFGKARGGSPEFLREAGARHGFDVEIVEKITADSAGSIEAVSSTATRMALERGDVKGAAHLLGHPFFALGTVIKGEQIGRTLGIPTANIKMDPSSRLRHGIYAVHVCVEGSTYKGVASYGRRPTFDNGQPLLESYLFDFSGDLYGKEIEVEFMDWLRPELKFESIEDLKVQMQDDVRLARVRLGSKI
jgi:riboflavin kinase / FMN adenylyltransferase